MPSSQLRNTEPHITVVPSLLASTTNAYLSNTNCDAKRQTNSSVANAIPTGKFRVTLNRLLHALNRLNILCLIALSIPNRALSHRHPALPPSWVLMNIKSRLLCVKAQYGQGWLGIHLILSQCKTKTVHYEDHFVTATVFQVQSLQMTDSTNEIFWLSFHSHTMLGRWKYGFRIAEWKARKCKLEQWSFPATMDTREQSQS